VFAGDVNISIDTGHVVNTMRGGIGASWHAIEQPIPYSDKPAPAFGGIRSHGGSGWGGYPPAEDDKAWSQIDRHARWLGLDFNRLEFEQRIYEPQRNQFSWDNPEMRILYRILDWCEKNKADVFLQQMWGNVAWNAFPQWRDDPVGRVHSGPYSIDDFAEGLAKLVEHLVKAKGYTCIRWLCIVNEPVGKWSWWQKNPNELMPLRPGLAAVRKALDARGIHIPLSGPEDTFGVPEFDPKRYDFLDLLGAMDFHTYSEDFDRKSNGSMARQDKNAADWAAWTHQRGWPLFMSEFGTMANGWGADHPGPGVYESALKDAELVVRRLNAGVDGLNRWSFINRGDLDGQWQFIETWDRKEHRLLETYTPHANTYYLLGLLTRFSARHSDVLACEVRGGREANWQGIFSAALRSRKGNLTIAVVNDAEAQFDARLHLDHLGDKVLLYRYRVSQRDRDRADLRIEPQGNIVLSPDSPDAQDQLPPMSLTVYSTWKLDHAQPGIITDE